MMKLTEGNIIVDEDHTWLKIGPFPTYEDTKFVKAQILYCQTIALETINFVKNNQLDNVSIMDFIGKMRKIIHD